MSIRERINRLKQVEMEILNMISAENMKIYQKIAELNRIRMMLNMPFMQLVARRINPAELIQRARLLEQDLEEERRQVNALVSRREEVAREIFMLESQYAAQAQQPLMPEFGWGAEATRATEARRRRDIEFLLQELNAAIARGDRQTIRYIREELRRRGVYWV
jgi:hypothetical protein